MAEQQKQPSRPTPPPNNNRNRKPKGIKVMNIIYIAILVALAVSFFSGGNASSKQAITWDRLEPILERHDYESITVINQEVAEIRMKREAVKRDTATYRDIIGRNFSGGQGAIGFYTYNIGNFEHFDKELAIVEERTGEHISYNIEKRQAKISLSDRIFPVYNCLTDQSVCDTL